MNAYTQYIYIYIHIARTYWYSYLYRFDLFWPWYHILEYPSQTTMVGNHRRSSLENIVNILSNIPNSSGVKSSWLGWTSQIPLDLTATGNWFPSTCRRWNRSMIFGPTMCRVCWRQPMGLSRTKGWNSRRSSESANKAHTPLVSTIQLISTSLILPCGTAHVCHIHHS